MEKMHLVPAKISKEDFEFLLQRYPHYFEGRKAKPNSFGKKTLNPRIIKPSASHMVTNIVRAWIQFEKERMEAES